MIMARSPLPGRCKSRLAADIGAVPAARFARFETVRLLRAVGKDGRWDSVLCVTPDSAVTAEWAAWRVPVERAPQGRGTLGERMGRWLAGRGRPTIIIGSDTPAVGRKDIAAAVKALRGSDAVFGPAEDGGYWLIGLARQRPARTIFQGVRWSTSDALSDTLASLPRDFKVDYLHTKRDVDTAADLAAVRHEGLASKFR